MAKDFSTIAAAGTLTTADKILVGQTAADGVETLAKLKRFMESPGISSSQQTGIIIPMYIYPTNSYTNADYLSLIDFKRKNRTIPMIAITNPDEGAGASVDAQYTEVHNRMQAAGIKVIGYVPTQYRAASVTTVKAAIDNWKSLYPEISGIFFDEQSDGTTNLSEELAYYLEVADYAREVGLGITVSNPGYNLDEMAFQDIFDIVIEWENSVWPSSPMTDGPWPGGSKLWKRGLLKHTSTVGALAGADATIFAEVLEYYGWVYVTDDIMDNPWDTVGLMQEVITAIKLNS